MAPFYPPLPEIRPANLVGSALAGYGAVQDTQNASARNALSQIQLGKAQRGESALADFTKTGDMKGYMRADPKAALEMQDAFSKMDERQQKVLMDKVKVFDDFKGHAVNNPETYKPMLDALGPEFSKFFPTPEKFAAMSPAQRQSELYMKETAVESIKKGMNDYQRLKLQNVDIPKAQADIAHKRADTGTKQQGLQLRALEVDKHGGGWATSPDGKKRLYFTPGSPPPADWTWDKVGKGGKGKDEYDKETVYTPTNPILGTAGGYKKTERKIPRKTAAPEGEGPTPTEQDVPLNTRRKAADGSYWRNDNGVITKEQ